MRTSIRINKEVLEKILNVCEEDNRSFSNLIALLIKANGKEKIDNTDSQKCVHHSLYVNKETKKLFEYHIKKGMSKSGIVRGLCAEFIKTIESYKD